MEIVFFFKQKTAYEMLRSLVGSEMCIRDRLKRDAQPQKALNRLYKFTPLQSTFGIQLLALVNLSLIHI